MILISEQLWEALKEWDSHDQKYNELSSEPRFQRITKDMTCTNAALHLAKARRDLHEMIERERPGKP